MCIDYQRALLFTDALRTGWGMYFQDLTIVGIWTEKELLSPYQYPEDEECSTDFQCLQELDHGRVVVLMNDSATVMAYIKTQGSTVSLVM